MKSRAQISVEYLIIIGFIFAILIPGTYLFYTNTLRQSDEATSDVINKIGNEVVNSAKSMYFVGERSWVTLEVVFPETVVDYYILDATEFVVVYDTQEGRTESVFFSDINMSGPINRSDFQTDPPYTNSNITTNPHPGLVNLRIESRGSWVYINQTA